MPVVISHKGDFSKTSRFFKRIKSKRIYKRLEAYGQMGVDALREATPKRTGKTADSWSYEIKITDRFVTLIWKNSNVVNDWANVAVLIQYGHATRGGAYVKGIDYINPAMRPVFEQMAKEVWMEVTIE